ncbi:MAG TPA: molybdopterin-binding protein [Casimicrobiaceae bacterium]|nr:molybdopterin-binding protein [Casimicrobiaceae bacterium]
MSAPAASPPPIGVVIVGDEILSGKRQDKHLAHAIATLGRRGLGVDRASYVGDDRARLTGLFRDSFARGELVFSFGGIGATPDDQTRQAVAAALGVPLEPHPGAVAEIVARFGPEAHPHRIRMAEFPAGADLIPNPFNGVAAFSVRDHHFFPGFPQMAWPMMEWVLDTRYPHLRRECAVERAIAVYDVGESQLLPLMDENVARFPDVKLFSLPAFLPGGGRRIELGVRGPRADADAALDHLVEGVRKAGHRYEPLDPAPERTP